VKRLYLVALLSMFGFQTLGQTGASSPSSALTQAGHQYQELYSQKKYGEATPYAQQAVKLALGDPKVHIADRIDLLNDLAELYYLQSKYAQAEKLARQVLALRQSVPSPKTDFQAIAVSEEDIAELLDLQGKFQDAAVFRQRARAALEQTRGDTIPTSALGREDTVIKQSVLDFFDSYHAEDRGYGRYTYVLFPSGGVGCERCVKLLAALFEGTPPGPANVANRAVVNIFELPVVNGQRDKVRVLLNHPSGSDLSPKILTQYNFAVANDLLTKSCASYRELNGKFCGTLAQGPYLVTYAFPVSAYATLPHPYLIVDMSNVNPRAFHFFLEQVKMQVGNRDISDDRRVTATYTRMVSLALDASDVLDPITKAVEQWVKIVK
jgi:tetratricopeptide (TPR) repeat protein